MEKVLRSLRKLFCESPSRGTPIPERDVSGSQRCTSWQVAQEMYPRFFFSPSVSYKAMDEADPKRELCLRVKGRLTIPMPG